jgi:hypothetical protein
VELIRLSSELLVAMKKAQGTFLRSVLENEGRCWDGVESTQSGKHFAISINMIKKSLSAIWIIKSVGLDGIPGEILNLSGKP